MILSHKHRFIFVKVPKTASTSIEVALSRVCEPNDIVTPISEEDLRADAPPRNYIRADLQGTRLLRSDGRLDPDPKVDFFNHMRLDTLMSYVSSDVFEKYFKFGFVRNPWDRIVSLYHWSLVTESICRKASFADFVRSKPHAPSVWGQLSVDRKLALDFVGRYEHLEQDFESALRMLNLPSIPLIHVKAGIRPPRPYRDYYDDELREFVAMSCRREIETFGYAF